MLWVAPLLVIAAGAAWLAATLRTTAAATVELRDECAQLEELRTALADLQVEADGTRATLDRIRSRPDRTSSDQ